MVKRPTSRLGARILLLLVAFALAQTTTACFLQKKKKQAKSSAQRYAIVDETSIYFDRLEDRESARIQFKTKKLAHCELRFYSQEKDIEPTAAKPTVVPCSSAETARVEFTETLTGLRTDTLYFVVIAAWADGTTVEQAEAVTVKEQGDGDQTEGKLADFHVARFDIPLLTAEVHFHKPSQALDVSELRTRLGRKTGCQQGVPDKSAPFRDAAKDIGITNFATADYATATAVPHPDFPERLLLTYKSLNEGAEQPWTFRYMRDGKDAPQLEVRPVSRILNMEMESNDIVAFDEPQLAEAVDPLALDTTKPLKLSWTATENLPEYSYLTVQIGRPDYDKSIYCIFQASKRTASIDASLLQGLDDGKHVILAELSTSKLWVKDGWLVTTYDWRSGRVEK